MKELITHSEFIELLGKYQHVIWDWNGTIVDDVELCHQINAEILKELDDRDFTFQDYLKNFQFPVKNFYEQIGYKLSDDEFNKINDRFLEKYSTLDHTCNIRPIALKGLESVAENGNRNSILTAANQPAVEAKIDSLGLGHLIFQIQGRSDNTASGKIDIAKKLIEKIHIHPSDITIIGDTLHDHEVAHSLDIDCILITGGHQDIEMLLKSGAKVVKG